MLQTLCFFPHSTRVTKLVEELLAFSCDDHQPSPMQWMALLRHIGWLFHPLQVVKLNKTQRALLLSEEGRVAAAFMKELVTIHTDLKAPPCQ